MPEQERAELRVACIKIHDAWCVWAVGSGYLRLKLRCRCFWYLQNTLSNVQPVITMVRKKRIYKVTNHVTYNPGHLTS